ncbi:pectinesterase family protein [Sorangium sp. So ce854]|uniref:pectinesterase family protein n=1 Tax=Sorangium sp. So ce854 TaxID=3133322 RepID=UPI003F634109
MTSNSHRILSLPLLLAALALSGCGGDDPSDGGSAGTSSTGGGSTASGASGGSSSGGGPGGSSSGGGAGNASSSTGGSGDGGSGAGGSGDGGSGDGGSGDGGSGDGGSGAGGSGDGGSVGTATRPQLTRAQAAGHTILKHLEKAGDLASGLVTDRWDPTAGAGDVGGFTPTYSVAASGGTHRTVQSAIDAAVASGGRSRVYIAVAPGTYREVICVPASAPPITLYSTNPDASRTVIAYNNHNGKAKAAGQPANPCNPSLSATTYGTSGSATFAAYAADFRAKNLTIANDTDERAVSGGKQAVALMTQADRLIFENVRLLGNQDTLYVKSPNAATVSRAYFKGCHVEGDVDFIFGRGTFVLDGCTIRYLTARQGATGGYIVAPSTDARNDHGILIINSDLTAEAGTPDGLVYLGRAWDEGQNDLSTYAANVASGVYPNGQAIIRDSTLGPHIRRRDPWHASTVSRPYSSVAGTYPANRLHEHANTGPGSAPP